MKNKDKNVLTLAYIGDAIYELLIRTYLINKGTYKVNDLQHMAIEFVSAKAQSMYLEKIMSLNILTKVEEEIILRARNNKASRHPKNTDILTYKHATALEALFGYLYLEKDYERINLLLKNIVGEEICIYTEKM